MRNDGTYLAQLLQEQQRPHPMYMRQQYHFMGGPGWINDPNGLVWYKDAYHFFYQYNPVWPHLGRALLGPRGEPGSAALDAAAAGACTK